MTKQLCFRFEHGGELTAILRPEIAPYTINEITANLPYTSTLFHSRWCGREVYTPIRCYKEIERENQSSQVSTGDVAFWRKWGAPGSPETLSFYYGPEQIRYITGPLQVNIFASIPQEQWPIIEEIGLRVWQKGTEQVVILLI
jgi:hypothetical protein